MICATLMIIYICKYQIKVWDMRQPTAAATLALSERVYCMDARSQILVEKIFFICLYMYYFIVILFYCYYHLYFFLFHLTVVKVAATADKQMHVFDLTAGNKVSEFKSPLTYQTKSLCIFHDW